MSEIRALHVYVIREKDTFVTAIVSHPAYGIIVRRQMFRYCCLFLTFKFAPNLLMVNASVYVAAFVPTSYPTFMLNPFGEAIFCADLNFARASFFCITCRSAAVNSFQRGM